VIRCGLMGRGRTKTIAMTWIPAFAIAIGAWRVVACSSSGAGANGASAFVGTWLRSGSQTVTCSGTVTVNALSGNLVITLGSTAGTIVGTQPDGCVTTYSVNGNVATAAPGQTCDVTFDGGLAEMVTVVSHTLSLSPDGNSLGSMASDKIDKTATMTMCTGTGSNTYTKQ
jgi:hypothetical protein